MDSSIKIKDKFIISYCSSSSYRQNSQLPVFQLIRTTGWNDYGYVTQFELHFKGANETTYNKIGYVNLYCKNQVNDDKWNISYNILQNPHRKIWMMGVHASFYQNLRNRIADISLINDFLCEMNDLIYDPLQLQDLRNEIGIDNPIISQSVLRDDSYVNVKDFYKISSILQFKKHYQNNQEISFFKKENLDWLIKDIDSKNMDKSWWLNLHKNIHSPLFCNFLQNLCYTLINYYTSLSFSIGDNILTASSNVFLDLPSPTNTEFIINPYIYIGLAHVYKKIKDENLNNLDEVNKILGFLLEINDSKNSLYEIISNILDIQDVLSIDSAEKISEINSSREVIGQYTSLNTLKFLIKPENESTTPPLLRLTNLSQLNDPLEGKVIKEFVEEKVPNLGIEIIKDGNNIFISSATLTEDNLPMWKQYGQDGTGIELIYSSSYLQTAINSGVELYRMCYLEKINNELRVKSITADKDNKIKEEVENNLKTIVKKLNNICSENKIIEILNNALGQLTYLFKSADYAYENELRFVQKTNFYSDNVVYDEIEVDGFKVPFLRKYVENIPLSYSKVKLGPKAIDKDYIEPYIQYCNPNIEVSVSKISYR